jgi:glycosyltransferase involved in cell wall biosynthesis
MTRRRPILSMPQNSSSNEPVSTPPGRFIYIACPWTPVGGGMFKVADYLIQTQASKASHGGVQLRPLDTRGGGHAALSLWVLTTALAKLVRGRLGGRLAGVHVNMAERLSLWRKSAIIVTCRALGVPAVLHLHAAQLHHFYRALPSPLQRLTRWVFSLPESVVVLGAAARRFVTEELGVPPHRVEIVINGVPEPETPPQRRPASPDAHKVLFLGNLSERKGVSDLLRALARPGFDAAKLQVCIAGGGDVPAYQAMARILGIESFVHFEGWCDQARVADLLAQADVLVLPSYDEGLPLVILEALAHGAAVVCTPVGEIPSALSDGINASFVTPGDVDGIAAALQKLLREPELLERLARNGRLLYEQEFSIARFFASVARIHQRHFGAAAEPTRSATLTQEIAR